MRHCANKTTQISGDTVASSSPTVYLFILTKFFLHLTDVYKARLSLSLSLSLSKKKKVLAPFFSLHLLVQWRIQDLSHGGGGVEF